MFLTDLFESNQQSLFHATKWEYYKDQLEHDMLTAAMIHRYWKDGRRHDRGQPNWEDHVWIKGLSLSRDIRFCLKWGNPIFELDKSLITTKYKILPVTWFSSSINKSGSIRRESEEFLWMETSDLTGDGVEIVKYADNDKLKFKPLHKYCKSVIISEFFFKILPKDAKQELETNCKKYCDKWEIPLKRM